MTAAVKKNFTYGDLWENKPPKTSPRGGREEVAAYRITSNVTFLNFLHDHGYSVYLDAAYQGYAHTDVGAKEVVLNSNYPDHLLEVFLKHELGHLLLFDVNQFTTVRNSTMRSLIARELYTPERARKFGFLKLLRVENIIQDIIIETVSNGQCVCINLFQHEGCNGGVKHLSELESVTTIAKEVCAALLPEAPAGEEKEEASTPEEAQALKEALQQMLEGLRQDMEEIADAMEADKKEDFETPLRRTRVRKMWTARNKLASLKDLEVRKGTTPSRAKAKDALERELAKLEEDASTEHERAEAKRARSLERLGKKLERQQALEEVLQEALEAAEEAANSSEEVQEEGLRGEKGEPSEEGDAEVTPGDQKVDSNISRNLTDHLLSGEEAGNTHTYDCGLPHPVTVRRNESYRNEQAITVVDAAKKVKKVVLADDSFDLQTSGRQKTTLREHTYFKANKKEVDETDMLKGRRKLRMSGVNVLVGLDVSGSMTHEWGALFKIMSDFVEDLKGRLDIEKVYYFTYDNHLKQWSDSLKDLKLEARGGNAFGYVYQEVMQQVPLLQRNEIILVTDCGDNLGFPLQDVCEVTRNSEIVENHISIIDTEGAGFYSKEGFDEKDWALYSMHDKDLYRNISQNIERLIER